MLHCSQPQGSVRFSSSGIYALGQGHKYVFQAMDPGPRFMPSLSRFPKAADETVLVLVWLTIRPDTRHG